jgi:recombination protein RecR
MARAAELLSHLPGVGEKTAQRFALFLATSNEAISRELGRALLELRDYVRPCSLCGNIAERRREDAEPAFRCAICSDSKRDPRLLCVVGRVQDLLAIERSGAMRGRYFVLGRLLSPLEGVGVDALPIDALRHRVRADDVSEVLVATPPSVDGEATALLVARELGRIATSDGSPVRVTRIASGVPHGGDLEFADPITMGRALAGRRAL